MIPELGQFALVLALCCAVAQSILPLVGSATGNRRWMAVGRPAAQAQGLFVAISYAVLTYSFIVNDFTVLYVANTSNTTLPLIYRISGVWGGHEGSVLLWVLILAVWTLAVTAFNRSLPLILQARVLAVLGWISVGFIAFILLTSNPFDRLFPTPIDGASLNPLLQDPGMAIHPPMLYMGYVGFAVAFAFSIAALLGGQLDSATLRWMRPWTNIAWMFLTIGIALGSYWAYYELGWGGWWFWDPVENASFMPWLAGTALIHSMAASEKRGVFKAWTVLLAVTAFSLSLLGTFLVRSGVLTSVHAFASDPERGAFILMFLVLVTGGSLFLFALRAPRLRDTADYGFVSREFSLLLNNVFMVLLCAVVLLGTLYPLIIDALGMGKLSVGPPWFNLVFLPTMVPVLALVGVGSLLNWKRDKLNKVRRGLVVCAIVAVILATGFAFLPGTFKPAAWLALALACWVTLTSLYGLLLRLRNRRNKLSAITHTPAAFWGMTIAHLGLAVFAVGVAITSLYSVQQDVRMEPGQELAIRDYTFTFAGVSEVRGPNYNAARAQIDITHKGEPETTLYAEKRVYDVRRDSMTEAGIDGSLTRDLFVALGEPLDNNAWAVRLYYKPFIRWIWLGAIFMSLGALIAALDRRYRLRKKVSAPVEGALGSRA
ncbi:MAG: heme lyase CcmF/NrfE family subunit [Gammaproteobacteria bacterium]|nr:heme lyase CcmF/NrfE family subunit [Gammaproteobacteria bacterium]